MYEREPYILVLEEMDTIVKYPHAILSSGGITSYILCGSKHPGLIKDNCVHIHLIVAEI